MTTKGKEVEEKEAAPQPAPAEEEYKAPVWRYFTVTADVQLATLDENVTAEAVEAAVKEQVILPMAVSILGFQQVNVVGVTSGGVSESSTPTEIDDGYGREAPHEDEE